MSYDIAVGIVGDNEVIARIDCLAETLRNFRKAELRNLIERNSLGRGDAAVFFSCKRLLVASVEEERDMGIFLTFRKVELGLSFSERTCANVFCTLSGANAMGR